MFILSDYGTTRVTANDFRFADSSVVHIRFGAGYISVSADAARTLAHQLQIAAERCDNPSQEPAAA